MKRIERLAIVVGLAGAAAVAYAPPAVADTVSGSTDNTDGFSIQADALADVDGEAFAIKVSEANVKAGGDGSFQVTIKAKEGFKVNDQYPLKIKFDDPPAGVSLPKQTLKKSDGHFEGKSTFVFDVPVKAKTAGDHAVAGLVKFSVCSDSQCQIKKVNIVGKVHAK